MNSNDLLGWGAAAATHPRTGAYAGSPLQRFITGAIAGALPRTCTVNNLANPLPR